MHDTLEFTPVSVNTGITSPGSLGLVSRSNTSTYFRPQSFIHVGYGTYLLYLIEMILPEFEVNFKLLSLNFWFL